MDAETRQRMQQYKREEAARRAQGLETEGEKFQREFNARCQAVRSAIADQIENES